MANQRGMKKKVTAKRIWQVLKKSFQGFSDDRITKMSSSLAYYTIFSMAPLLIIIISLSGLFLGQDAAEGKIYADRKSTRLNSSHMSISYAVFCLKKKI